MSSVAVAAPGRLSNSKIADALLPSRESLGFSARAAFFACFGVLGAFLAGLAFFPAFPLAGATGARRGARVAFLLAFGGSLGCRGIGCFFCNRRVHDWSPCRGDSAVTHESLRFA
jgi:hypothetical protein